MFDPRQILGVVRLDSLRHRVEDRFPEFPMLFELSVHRPRRHEPPTMSKLGQLSRKRLPRSPQLVVGRNAQGVANGTDHLGLRIFSALLGPVLGGDHWFERTEEAAIQLAQEVAHQMGLGFQLGLLRHQPAGIAEVARGRPADKSQTAQDFALTGGLGRWVGRHRLGCSDRLGSDDLGAPAENPIDGDAVLISGVLLR